MNIRNLFLLCGLCLLAATASAQCVRVRTDAGHACMTFSAADKAAARSYGLRLGAPHAQVQRTLAGAGWRLDSAWLREQDSANARGLVCGAGYDAVCSTAYVRQGRHVYLTFSATNAGTPLVGVADRE